ncbi:hypothetical protein AB0F91_07330 [Amycolatopsis sp. NPDC023774]|uniref:hypothetical protein n=1 Tax=Amycolatopsis sp. NPDC023774 TaxID=3155015 RepID=UPI0033D53DED
MSLRHWSGTLVGAVFLVLVTACTGSGGSGSGASDETAQSEVTTTGDPSVEGTGTETPRSTEKSGSIQVAGLPIGGSNNATDKDDCISVSLLNTPPDGVRVVVTEIHVDSADEVTAGGRCGGDPTCVSFTFTAQARACSIALTWLKPGDGAVLAMGGHLECDRSGCDGYRLEKNKIDLTNPLDEESSSSKTTESSSETAETTTETTSSTTSG